MGLVGLLLRLQLQVNTLTTLAAAASAAAPPAPTSSLHHGVKIEKPAKFDGTPNKLSNFLFTVKQYCTVTGVTDPVLM